MRVRRWGLGGVAVVVALSAGMAAGAPAAPAAARSGSTLRVAVSQEVDSLNPFLSITRTGTDILRANFEQLTTASADDLAPEPGLAERWEPSADKLTWTFTIRAGARWSDGAPITARDAAFTFDLMLRDGVARTANGNYVASWESVSAVDDRTLVVKTKTPQATMTALDIPIVPEHVWSKVADVGAPPALPMVASGPFVITEFKESQYTRLTANKSYWRGAPKIDHLDFVYYKNSDAAVQALLSGEVDLVNRLTPAQFDRLAGEPAVERNNAKGKRFNELIMNSGAADDTGAPIGDGHPALRDPRLRRAIAQAVDTRTLVEKVWGGYAEPGSGYVPPLFAEFHWSPPPELARPFDLGKANAALDAAGYARGGDGVRVDPVSGRPLAFRLMGHAGTNFDEQSAPFVKEWLREVGIAVEVRMVSDTKVNEATTAGTFDLAYSGWNGNPDPDYILRLQTCSARPDAQGKGATPDSFLCDPVYDALYAQQSQEFDRAKRVELVKRMQRVLHEQAPMVILGYDNVLEAYRKDRFAPFQVSPDPGGVIMNQQSYWGYYSATPVAMATGAGRSTGVVLGVVGGALVLAAAGALVLARRRRSTADERE
ncbi:ABC transporter substrate-binding protein [Actinokineospora iranica]|uniref:Peptide/nickel transport system substrate-binding protein n=1 Tax=Actinokineospora iranica TaxID=1271860 RepID=A0A1G6IQJ4_9PSEU|nr:ABC transporter substrate-binding protein [Actinokineospora iranica]SDC08305.1 peptide/nickel transport system substrate-binding protein [Actinokineospora iranica]